MNDGNEGNKGEKGDERDTVEQNVSEKGFVIEVAKMEGMQSKKGMIRKNA